MLLWQIYVAGNNETYIRVGLRWKCPIFCQILTKSVVYPQILTKSVVYPQILTKSVVYPQILTKSVVYPQILTKSVVYPQISIGVACIKFHGNSSAGSGADTLRIDRHEANTPIPAFRHCADTPKVSTRN